MNTPTALLTALLTADTPRWLVFTLLGLVAAAYGVCGLLTLVGHARPRTRPRGGLPTPASVLSPGTAPARGLVDTVPARKEATQ